MDNNTSNFEAGQAYIFYLRNPLESDHWKCGISSLRNAPSRIGTYQNAFGPSITENWKYIWLGTRRHVVKLESEFKVRYDDNIENINAGHSEWISNISEQQLLDSVEDFRDNWFIKVTDVPEEFKPFTIDKLDDVIKWYSKYLDT
jgi:hypothetical protein